MNTKIELAMGLIVQECLYEMRKYADIGLERPNCPANAIIGIDITKDSHKDKSTVTIEFYNAPEYLRT